MSAIFFWAFFLLHNKKINLYCKLPYNDDVRQIYILKSWQPENIGVKVNYEGARKSSKNVHIRGISTSAADIKTCQKLAYLPPIKLFVSGTRKISTATPGLHQTQFPFSPCFLSTFMYTRLYVRKVTELYKHAMHT